MRRAALPLVASEIEEIGRLYAATSHGSPDQDKAAADAEFVRMVHALFPRILASMKAGNPLTHKFKAEIPVTIGMTATERETVMRRQPCAVCDFPYQAHLRPKADPKIAKATFFHTLDLPSAR